jgi:hypothetical protein
VNGRDRRVPSISRRAFLAGAGASVFLLACSKDETPPPLPAETPGAASGEPRSFLTGVSSVPNAPTEDAYRAAFTFAGQAGEVVLIQRTPPWSEFLPSGEISDRTEDLTRLERDLVHDEGLRLFLAVDPTDPADRGRLGAPPSDLADTDFSNEGVRQAFSAYAQYLALNYQPDYLALGVEVNMFFEARGDGPFRNFQSLYFETYDAVKSISPDTKVFPTFQYEGLLGLLGGGELRPETWGLVDRFMPKMDMLALSTFPGFVFETVEALPEDYYARISSRTTLPVAFASVGWSSHALPGGSPSVAASQQASFLRRIFEAAEAVSCQLVVWYLGRDPTVSPTAGFDPLAMAGLVDTDGQPKMAWNVWRDNTSRPLANQ